MNSRDGDPQQKPSLWQVVASVLSAGFGVQSNANRKRDFQHASAGLFVGIGVVATILFILSIYGIVSWVIS